MSTRFNTEKSGFAGNSGFSDSGLRLINPFVRRDVASDMAYEILILSEDLSSLGQHVMDFFKAEHVQHVNDVAGTLATKKFRAVVMDSVSKPDLGLRDCEALLQTEGIKGIPVILLTSQYTLQDKLKAFDLGCDDFIDGTTPGDEVCARVNKSVFHQIANDQLSQRLMQATETARTAMVDNSDLGANIQFLLQVHQCDNLDQLGQQFFATIDRYGLSCSLQMRSEMGVKDMEAHGMAKDLESQLLLQLKDKGRYVDFGKRTIVNYDRVSLLIRNMPVDDAEKYGAIKDNTFCLVQGINSRIIALEDQFKLLSEKESLRKLSGDVKSVIGGLKNSYQGVMQKIVREVENASELIQHRVPHLGLTEEDERCLEKGTDQMVAQVNHTFNDGLKVDELFDKLENAVDRSLKSVSQPSKPSDTDNPPPKKPPNSDNVVELF